MSEQTLLEIKDIKKHYPVNAGLFSKSSSVLRAVDGVSFKVEKGQTIGLVGESGCGKSTVGKMILKLTTPTDGNILYKGSDIKTFKSPELKNYRQNVQVVFQDPYGSLNPRLKIGSTVSEGIKVHKTVPARQTDQRVCELLEMVGIDPSARHKYPHEFSGGQRQRIGIARALSVNPEFIVADEPVSSLDVSVRAQIVNLFMDIQQKLGLSYLFIAHDLGIVEFVSTRIIVMYLGKIVEYASKEQIANSHMHPYTKALYSSIPRHSKTSRRERITLGTSIPSPINPPSGCPFHPRCWMAKEICKTKVPVLEEKAPGHMAACHLV